MENINELLSSASIKAVSQINSSTKISYLSDMEIKYFISMLDYYFDVISNSDIRWASSLPSSLIVKAKTNLLLKDLNSKAFLNRYIDLRSNANIVKPEILDLTSTSKISDNNLLDLKYFIYKYEHYFDTISNLEIHKYFDELSTASLRVPDYFDINSTVSIYNHTNLHSKFYKPYTTDLQAQARITENNFMNFIYKLVQAPIITANCNTVADAYVRQDRPTLNYGTTSTLGIGSLPEGLYITVIRLDITTYKHIIQNDVNLISAILKLKVSGNYNNEIIDIYECDTSWNESSITWSNFNPTLKRKLFSFTCNSSTISIDVKNYLDELVNNNKTYIDLVFKLRNESNSSLVFLFSKEADIYNRPTIEIKYQNNLWNGFVELYDTLCSIYIKAKSNKDIISYLAIRQTSEKDLDSTVTIKQQNYLDILGQVSLQRKDYIDILANTNIFYSSDIDATAILKQTASNDLSSLINIVSSSSINSVVEISNLGSNSLLSNLIIRQLTNFDLMSNLNIFNYLDIDSIVRVQNSNFIDLDSIVQIKAFTSYDVDSNLYLVPNTTILSSVIIQRLDIVDTASNALLQLALHEDITSKATLTQLIDVLSSVVIQKLISSEIFSNSVLRKTDFKLLDSSAVIHKISDLLSDITIKLKSYDEILSQAYICLNSDVYSSCYIQGKLKDINCSANLFQNTNLSSHVEIYNYKDISTKCNVRRTEFLNIISYAILRQFNIAEINSTVVVIPIFESVDTNAFVNIRRFDVNNLNCNASINSLARNWVPNIHGKEVFKYDNRKLPRYWKRELFIP